MINFEFADNQQLRFGETSELPIRINNNDLYFMIIEQDTMNIQSYGSDVRGLNNLHKMLSGVEEHEQILILCNWKGAYQAHTFVCEKEGLVEKVRQALGDLYVSELASGLAY